MSIKEELNKVSQRIKDNAGVGYVPTLITLKQYENVCEMYGRQVAARLVEDGNLYIMESMEEKG